LKADVAGVKCALVPVDQAIRNKETWFPNSFKSTALRFGMREMINNILRPKREVAF
jgi:hypothetical protein